MKYWVANLLLIICTCCNSQESSQTSISYILIDGLVKDHFERLRASGKLPCLDSLVKRGLYVENGITSFPSMTGYAFYPYLTGKPAYESGVFGLRWFDRDRREGNLRNYVGRTNIYMNEDLSLENSTIFELFPDDYTASINSFLNRGTKDSRKLGWSLTTSKYDDLSYFGKLKKIPIFGNHIFIDSYENEEQVLDLALKQLSQNPKVHWITFPTLDARYHVYGYDENYDLLLTHIDSLIQVYIDYSIKLGHSNRHFAIISDHGMTEVGENIDPCLILKDSLDLKIERGRSTNLRKLKLDTPISKLEDLDAYFVINGNLTGYLYFKSLGKSNSWKQRNYDSDQYPLFDSTIEVLHNSAGIEFVIASKSKSIHEISNRKGVGQIRFEDEKFRYIVSGVDPLGYESQAFPYDSLLTSDQLLKLTYASKYPDAIVKIHGLMSHNESPDIVMCSKKGYDFGKDYEIFVSNYKGGHGGLHREMMTVPMILVGPKVKREVLPYLRSEDMGKLLIDILK